MSQPFFSFQYQIYPNRSDMVGIFVYMDFFCYLCNSKTK